MKFVIKAKPEDFIVEELAQLPLRKKGTIGVYKLTKKNKNTLDVLAELSRSFRIPFNHFSYGGRKDRHALTTQYISIQGKRHDESGHEEYSLQFVGFMDRPMGPDLIEANKFSMVVRKLTPEQIQKAEIEKKAVESFGYLNYFDDQRFGSVGQEKEFLAEKILLGHFNGALKLYMAATTEFDTKEERERKNFLSEHWREWDVCLKKAITDDEKNMFGFLKDHPADFLPLVQNISREELSFYFSAYQAFLWNELARRLLQQSLSGPFVLYPGAVGDYSFYQQLSDVENTLFSSLALPTFGLKAVMPNEQGEKIYQAILAERGVKRSMLNKIKIRRVYFKSVPRVVVIKPHQFSCEAADDKLYAGSKKLMVSCQLSRGSYGTMLLKRLFCFD